MFNLKKYFKRYLKYVGYTWVSREPCLAQHNFLAVERWERGFRHFAFHLRTLFINNLVSQ